jgi:hypothetical protein
MGIDYQIHHASVDMSKGFRQFQKADNALSKDHVESAVNHLDKGLNTAHRISTVGYCVQALQGRPERR